MRNKLVAPLAVLIVGTLAGAWFATWMEQSRLGIPTTRPSSVSADTGEAPVSFLNGFAPIAKKVLPAVVNIASSKTIRLSDQGQSPLFSDPFFRQFFGDDWSRIPREQRQRSLGSGVIVNADGYILTNSHVVAGADEIKISMGDKREFKGRIVGSDPKTDIAVVKIEATGLPTVSFSDSSKVQVGEFALAVGNPFGIGQTLTMGIISATGRGGLGIEDYEDFIQTDAAVNPGNSGGALVNVLGELVGINTAIVSGGGGGNQGVGFAVPVNMARPVMEEIIKHGKVTRGWLGVSIQSVTAEIATAFGLAGQPRGALVGDVTPHSPAERAGLNKGDIILELNGTQVRDSQELRLKISMMAPGAMADLKLLRDRQERKITATLGESPTKPESEATPVGSSVPGPILGLTVGQLTPQLAAQFDIPAGTTGVVITGVTQGSPAEDARLQRGDVIQEVDRKTVNTVEQFQRAVQAVGNQAVLLLINRGGSHSYVVLPAR
jgi:serine protease Do